MTSFKERLKYESYLAISSILNNKQLPTKICIIINSYDKDNIPQLFKEHPLIEIIYTDVDLKGHNKYYHTALKYPDSVIITIDDDVIYPATFVEDCIKAYKDSPTTVNAVRVHKIKYKENSILPYKQWEWESKETEASYDLFFTGVGGVVYPPNFFKKKDLNIEEIHKYIKTDDIFLNYLCRKYRIMVKRIPVQNSYEDINILPFKPDLYRINILYNNDLCLSKISFNEVLNDCKSKRHSNYS
jgi:hypothetical protein